MDFTKYNKERIKQAEEATTKMWLLMFPVKRGSSHILDRIILTQEKEGEN